MSEWKEKELRELITHKKGFAFKSANYKDSGRLVVRVSDTTRNSIDINSCVKIDEIIASNYKDYELSIGDIIIMTVGSWPDNPASVVGKVISVPFEADKALLNQNAVRIRGNGNIDNKYLYHRLKNSDFSGYIVNNAQGSANQASITLEDIFSFKFNLPSKDEQRAIASVLSSLDDKIDLLHHQNATLEAMAETLFRQWFVEEAKEDWESVIVGQFVETNKKTITKEYPFIDIKYLDTGSLNEGLITDLQYLKLNDAPSRAKRLVNHNDILISTVRPDQKHYGIIKNPEKNLVVSTGFCVITCTKIDPHFIYLLLTNDEITDYLHSIAEGSTSTYPSLKPSDIEKIEFQLPPIEKLKEFQKIASNFWDKINHNQTKIHTLTALRDTLLPKLMSGEVRVEM